MLHDMTIGIVKSNNTATGIDDSVDADLLEPEPLRAKMPTPEPYPVTQLGDILGDAANDIAEHTKAPIGLCCQSVLASASLATQAHFDVQMPWGETKPTSLFFLTVGESGERKSAADNLVLEPARSHEKTQMREFAEYSKQYNAEHEAWKHSVDTARKSVKGRQGKALTTGILDAVNACGDEPTPPILPIRFITDPTIEGQYKLLVVSQPSVALFSDEGGLLIGGHALNSDNALKTMARWCKLWDGSPFDRVRAIDGAGILYGRRMALHQLAQPEVMNTLLSDRVANGQGFLARCLIAYPTSTIGTRLVNSFNVTNASGNVARLHNVLDALIKTPPPYRG